MITIKFKRTNPDSVIPKRATPEAAALDCFANGNAVLWRGQRALISLGVMSEIPRGWFGLLRPRSGLAAQGFTMCGSGVIDSDYRGLWMFSAINLSEEGCWNIRRGERICQVLILPVPELEIVEADALNETERGTGGYGSTGK